MQGLKRRQGRTVAMRVGIDLVSAETIGEAVSAHGDRYLERVYGPDEIADCRRATGLDLAALAARFAAKEAAFKVLRVNDRAVSWRDVQVRRDPSGAPTLSLTGAAATMARDARIRELSISLTHERGYAAAVVIAEIEPTADR